MRWLQSVVHSDPEMQDLMRENARTLVYTIAGLYFVVHVVGTVGFPHLFSPSLWLISIFMASLIGLTLHLLRRHYFLSQILWLLGLGVAIFLGYALYRAPQALLLWIALPLLAVATLGVPVAAASVLVIVIAVVALMRSNGVPPVYGISIAMGSVFIAIVGWSALGRLLTALDTASYHYHQAQRLLEETRNHRAEISRILKDRDQANYQLEQANKMLAFARAQAEEARENRNRFVLAVSHELRSPLNFIIGFSDLMVNAPQTYAPLEQWPPGLYDDIQEIYASSRHLMRLINDILDMGKIEAGQMTLYRERARIEQVIEEVRAMLAHAFEQKGIELRLEIPPDLPSVFIDTTRIRQVLLNLLNNGLRFTDQGYVALRVERQENALLISVRDTGSGIAPEDLPRVFEEFRQVGEENWRRRAGSGLGLHISRQFVELHGGTMGVESTLGEGTLFYFTLPLTPAHYDLSTAPSGAPAPPPQPPVLLLSSDAEELSTLQHFLDEYRLHPAESPEEALLKARQLFPRAILLSGEVDPLPAGQLPYDLPIIRFLLPRPFLQDHKIHAYLVKPLSRQKLLQTLQSLGKPEARLLIIDDDPAMIRFIQQSCRAAGQAHYTLFSALSAAQADEILACQPIDAILLDLELPDMHGVEWLKAFRARPAMESVPVIIISAQDAPTGLLSPGRPALELFLRHSLPPNVLAEFIKVALEKIPPQYP